MIPIHPQILEKDGKKEFVVIPYEEFLEIQDALMDFEDLKDLREAKSKEKDSRGMSLSEARRELNI